MKNIYKIIVIIISICCICFVAYASFSLVQEDQELLNYGDNTTIYSTNDTIKLKDNVNASKEVNITKGNYTLVIDCDTNWKINYDVDGKSYQKEGNGTETINLGAISSMAEINYNQLSQGSSNLEVYNSNNTFVASIYQAGKTVNLDYKLIVV